MLSTFIVGGCTVQPLNATRSDSTVASNSGQNPAVSDELRRLQVVQVSTRVAQQTRNELVRLLNGGSSAKMDGKYSVNLLITSRTSTIAVESSAKAPTAAQVTVTGTYILSEAASSKELSRRKITTLAAYDRTPQSFANLRSRRDAENRAARELAQSIYLALAQDISRL